MLRVNHARSADRKGTTTLRLPTIIAADGETTVFVEVKARRGSSFGEAAVSIPGWKRRRIGAMALDYLAWTGRLDHPCRFDVVAIDGAGGPHPSINVIEHAFDL